MAQKQSEPEKLTRREVLHEGGVLAAGVALASNLTLGAGDTGGRRIRIGVVGGGFGRSFYWHEHPGCIVQAVSDLIPARRDALMKTYRCDRAYESLEKLILDKDVEAVAVFTGAPDHVKHSIACLEAGKHVLCAVPAGMSIEECRRLLETVRRTGLTYMLAETSWYHQSVITARQWYAEGKFGEIFSTEAEYLHPGLEPLFFDAEGKRTWRYGFPPMHYPTHCTGYLVGVTGERMTQVSCVGWGDDSPFLKDNVYDNRFWNATAFFTTNRGNAFRIQIYWNAAVAGCERGQWYGTRMSFYDPTPNGASHMVQRWSEQSEKDDGGFQRRKMIVAKHQQQQWWRTDMLPSPLRHASGHGGSHTFLTHEFIDSLLAGRPPAIDVYAALALTAPGIVAHQSAMKGGEQLKVPGFDPAAPT